MELADLIGYRSELVREVARQPDGAAALAAVFRYILEAAPKIQPEELRALVAREVSMEAQKAVMTAGQRLREEGRVDGQRALVAKLLRLRFGPLSDDAERRIEGADADLLGRWAERVVTAQSLDGVFAD